MVTPNDALRTILKLRSPGAARCSRKGGHRRTRPCATARCSRPCPDPRSSVRLELVFAQVTGSRDNRCCHVPADVHSQGGMPPEQVQLPVAVIIAGSDNLPILVAFDCFVAVDSPKETPEMKFNPFMNQWHSGPCSGCGGYCRTYRSMISPVATIFQNGSPLE